MGIDSISANERSNSIVKNLEADRRFLYNQKEVCLVSLSCCMDILNAHKRVLSITRSAHYTGNNLPCIWNNAVSIAIPYIHPSFLWKLLDFSWSSPCEREGGDTLPYLCGGRPISFVTVPRSKYFFKHMPWEHFNILTTGSTTLPRHENNESDFNCLMNINYAMILLQYVFTSTIRCN